LCSDKLNYRSKKREIKRLKRPGRKSPSKSVAASPTPSRSGSQIADNPSESQEPHESTDANEKHNELRHIPEEEIWKETSTNKSEVRGREDDFDEYLADLLM
jgi:protein FRA10AC1